MTDRLSAIERDAWANARDFQIDADTLRDQASRLRQPAKGRMLSQAETLEMESASWRSKARSHAPRGVFAKLRHFALVASLLCGTANAQSDLPMIQQLNREADDMRLESDLSDMRVQMDRQQMQLDWQRQQEATRPMYNPATRY